jgi:hypothetical protein
MFGNGLVDVYRSRVIEFFQSFTSIRGKLVMSSAKTVDAPADLSRANELKRDLVTFATAGPLKKEFAHQRKMFFELSEPADKHETENMLDWFLFDWFDERGVGLIGHFLQSRKRLTADDRRILEDWEDSINSVFEIRSIGKNWLQLREMDSEDSFAVSTVMQLEQTPFRRGQYIAARLLPLGERFIFSGLQFIMPDRKSAKEAIQMRRELECLSSPEAIEKAQQEQCNAFCECFGCTEMTVPSGQLRSTLARFQRYLMTERRDAKSGQTAAERFRAAFGRDLNLPDMPSFPEQLLEAGEVTLLCDEFDGIVLLPDYARFKRLFETDSPEKATGDWHELVWRYIKDPDIPLVAFERAAERHPERVEKLLRQLLDDENFSLEHLYALLLHYKEPVEGLDHLEDDQRLWDLLNGNSASRTRASKQGGKKAATAVADARAARGRAKKTSAPAAINQSRSSQVKPRAATNAAGGKKRSAGSRTSSKSRVAHPTRKR